MQKAPLAARAPPAPRPCPPRRRAARGRLRTAPRRAPRERSLRRCATSPALEPLDDLPQLGFCLLEGQVARHGCTSSTRPAKRPSASSTSTRSSIARRGRGADHRVSPAYDRVAAGESRPRRQRAQPPRAVLERGAAPLEQQASPASQAVGVALQPLALPVEGGSASAPQSLAASLERGDELCEIGDDEAGGRRWRGRAGVRGKVAERGVLLVADRGDDGYRAVDHCPHEPLVAEGKQILEASPAACEHDDVHRRLSGHGAQRGGDLSGGRRPLHHASRPRAAAREGTGS